MTSKKYFFNLMKEDLRHRVWMIALSCLGSVVSLPIALLLTDSMEGSRYAGQAEVVRLYHSLERIAGFFHTVAIPLAGIIAVLGALIVAIGGFRYLFHTNMVDTYHSMPVKKHTLFTVLWLDGFLIWFVPFIVNYLLTVLLAQSRFATVQSRMQQTGLPKMQNYKTTAELQNVMNQAEIRSVFILIITFLLVYHLALIGVMLAGNVWNAFVSFVFLGNGIYVLKSLLEVMANRSYVSYVHSGEKDILWKICSPIVYAVYLLMEGSRNLNEQETSLLTYSLMGFGVAVLCGLLAGWLYIRRPSERAQTGLESKPLSIVMRLMTSLMAAIVGWIVMGEIAGLNSDNRLVWECFGAFMGAVLSFGVLNILFCMEFRAFLKNKLFMAAVTVAAIACCLIYRYDLTGFDAYVPKPEKIVSMAVSDRYFNSFDFGSDLSDWQQYPVSTDGEYIAALMQEFVVAQERQKTWQSAEQYYGGAEETVENIEVCVKLTGGKEILRKYSLGTECKESLKRLLTSEPYVEKHFLLPTKLKGEVTNISIENDWDAIGKVPTDDGYDKLISDVIEAYNADIMENREKLADVTRRIATVRMGMNNEWRTLAVSIEMTRTLEALRNNGMSRIVDGPDRNRIRKIRLCLKEAWEYKVRKNTTTPDIARLVYGLATPELTERVLADGGEQAYRFCNPPDNTGVYVENPEEIAELAELLSYDWYYMGYMVPYQAADISVEMDNGERYNVAIPKGMLPEKYIERFADISPELEPAEMYE